MAVSDILEITSNCCLHEAKKDQLYLFYVGDIQEDAIRKQLSGIVPIHAAECLHKASADALEHKWED